MAILETQKTDGGGGTVRLPRSRSAELPFLPEVIGVITSPTGAVIRDIMHRLDARFPPPSYWPVSVQGERAAARGRGRHPGFNAIKPGGPVRDETDAHRRTRRRARSRT